MNSSADAQACGKKSEHHMEDELIPQSNMELGNFVLLSKVQAQESEQGDQKVPASNPLL